MKTFIHIAIICLIAATMRDVDGECYNVLGQRISQYTKGLVIYKGKKYLNR